MGRILFNGGPNFISKVVRVYWYSNEVLRQVRVSNIPIVECNSTIMYDGHITDSMICAGDRKGGKDSC